MCLKFKRAKKKLNLTLLFQLIPVLLRTGSFSFQIVPWRPRAPRVTKRGDNYAPASEFWAPTLLPHRADIDHHICGLRHYVQSSKSETTFTAAEAEPKNQNIFLGRAFAQLLRANFFRAMSFFCFKCITNHNCATEKSQPMQNGHGVGWGFLCWLAHTWNNQGCSSRMVWPNIGTD